MMMMITTNSNKDTNMKHLLGMLTRKKYEYTTRLLTWKDPMR